MPTLRTAEKVANRATTKDAAVEGMSTPFQPPPPEQEEALEPSAPSPQTFFIAISACSDDESAAEEAVRPSVLDRSGPPSLTLFARLIGE